MSLREPQPAESVWDYPRPPRVEHVDDRVTVTLGGVTILDTTDVVRVLETSHPPAYYLLMSEFASGTLSPAAGISVCEFKGHARYLTLTAGGQSAEAAAWTYDHPWPGFETLSGRLALYPGRMDACTVAGETVIPQEGGFYGGWITSWVTGPFKGAPGTRGW